MIKKLLGFIIAYVCASTLYAQDSDYIGRKQRDEIARRAHYKDVVTQIFKDDELFVLFYLDLALVVDPTKDTQVVESITTSNPWESLINYIEGKNYIYFCPSGNQLKTAIEYMPCPLDSDMMMSDHYGMYRLSSPEELFKNRGECFRSTELKAAVFGGLKYDEKTMSTSDNILAFRGKRGAIEGYNYLKSTYDEAVYIDSLFRINGIKTALLTGANGTEKSFSQIPSRQINILHIASHGFYEPNKDYAESSSLQEWTMSHAGLVLSGVDNDVEDRTNDGRLTAYEISQTDLSSVNLVVLSACDTGLGDIKENDVYGLLKGFKKAGAGTLLVTLSEVNDTATYLLMKLFYGNIFRGENPHLALKNAQKYIRHLDKGQFDKSMYWKPFILVDDLDRNIGQIVTEECRKYFLQNIVDTKSIYSEYTLFPNWDEIRKKLKPDDAVIRICPYAIGEDSIDYVALIGNPTDGRCNVIRLFSLLHGRIGNHKIESSRTRYRDKYDLPFEYIDSLFWKPIIPYVSDKHRIFCQAAGIFNKIPIESMPSIEGKFTVNRLSSLNVLLEHNTDIRIDSNSCAYLFGGLTYDMTEMQPEGYPESDLVRGSSDGFSFLYGSKMETDSIAEVLKNKLDCIQIYQRDSGTEPVFRSILVRGDAQIVHLATHSFFYHFDDKCYSIADYLLNYNAFALTGANSIFNKINGKQHFESSKNDGIMQGAEIAKADLSALRLLSLSMCNPMTDKNQRDYTDAPWDIIKAFKLAGTKTILHSLWNVDDKATATLMERFYESFAIGHSARDSLEYAKQNVKKNSKWKEPDYWASFVLIDAIE